MYRWAEGRDERLPALATELIGVPVDVIVAQGGAAGRAAKDATGTIPIVVGASNDPVEEGLVASLARPGGNVTGLSLANPTLVAKRLELLKQTVPHGGRIAVLIYSASATSARDWDEVQKGGRVLGLRLSRYDVGSGDDFAGAFAAMAMANSDAVLVLPNRFFSTAPQNRDRLLSLVALYRLPMMADSPGFTRAGGLMSYGADPGDLYRRSSTYVDKILKGANPGDLPIELPTTFDFVINLKTAQALGLTIPQSVLQQATEVIQ